MKRLIIPILFAILLAPLAMPAQALVSGTVTSASASTDPQLLNKGAGLFCIDGTFSTATISLERIAASGNWVDVSGGTGLAAEKCHPIDLKAYSVVRITAVGADGSTSIAVEIREEGR